jgi:membrane fusion protein (multidrug efflux system)
MSGEKPLEDGGTVGAARGGRRTTIVMAAVLGVLVLGALGLMVANRLAPRREVLPRNGEPVVPVSVVTVLRTNLPERVLYAARLLAERVVVVGAEEKGLVVEVGAETGARVRAGQALIRLDDRIPRAECERAEIGLRQAEDDHRRWEALRKDGSVSVSEYEGVRNRRDLARVALDEARARWDRCVVRSPVEGLVEDRWIEAGEIADAGKPLFRLVVTDRVKVSVDVAERDLGSLAVGRLLGFAVDALGGRAFTGRVSVVAPAADPASNTFPVELLVENPGLALKPGFIVRVEVPRGEFRDALAVPIQALVPDKGRYVAYVVRAGVAVRRVARLAAVVDTLAVVESGLEAGDEVVVEGQRMLADGVRIRTRP